MTYIRRERDWLERATAEGRVVDQARLLPMLPPTIGGVPTNGGHTNGNGHDHAHDGHGAVAAIGPGRHE